MQHSVGVDESNAQKVSFAKSERPARPKGLTGPKPTSAIGFRCCGTARQTCRLLRVRGKREITPEMLQMRAQTIGYIVETLGLTGTP